MKIAVNTRLLLKDKLEGIGWFSFESLKRITTQHPEHHFYFFFDRNFSNEFIFSENITPIILHPQARHPFLYFTWFEISVKNELNKVKPDLFLSPDGFLSLNTSVKSLPVIHDLNFEYYPKDIPFITRNYYRYFFPKFARKATRIATVSEYSKQDLIKLYDCNPALIDVVYNGANEAYLPISEVRKHQIKKKYSQDCEYFLFIGALNPRKNLSRLFSAFDNFKKTTGLSTKLLIVGKKKWWTEDINNAFIQMQHKEEVIFTGRLDNDELNAVLGSALALTYVSIFEGFGIPILEAFNCDTPVITSNCTSMPEVGGEAAFYVDPFSIESIENGLKTIALDPVLRESLIIKSRERRKIFSWQKTSELLWNSIERCF